MHASQPPIDHDAHRQYSDLDLRGLPTVYVLAAHLSINEQHEAEDTLSNGGAPLTYNITEANIILGNVSKPRRAKSELLWKGVHVEDITDADKPTYSLSQEGKAPARKWRKLRGESRGLQRRTADIVIDDSSTASETEDEADVGTRPLSQLSTPRVPMLSDASSPGVRDTPSPPTLIEYFPDRVTVVRIEWLNDSLTAGKALSLSPYTVYTGRLVNPKESATNRQAAAKADRSKPFIGSKVINTGVASHANIDHANVESMTSVSHHIKQDRIKDTANRNLVGKSFSSSTLAARQQSNSHSKRPTQLLHQTTSEHEEASSGTLPPMPDWVRENKIYACERATPLESPNQAFICQLKKIKLARLLTLDEVGVRAYSSSIASLAAYPYPIQSTREILALPSCDQKIAHLFHEYQTNGNLQAVADIEADPVLKILREFYEIWGVGAKTAREYYYDKGWRDLDDIIEHGWKSLSRVQQIGLKYYDDFMLKIPRAEVEMIAATITKHAGLVTDERVESIIVGGYRRGKSER